MAWRAAVVHIFKFQDDRIVELWDMGHLNPFYSMKNKE